MDVSDFARRLRLRLRDKGIDSLKEAQSGPKGLDGIVSVAVGVALGEVASAITHVLKDMQQEEDERDGHD